MATNEVIFTGQVKYKKANYILEWYLNYDLKTAYFDEIKIEWLGTASSRPDLPLTLSIAEIQFLVGKW